MVAVAQHQRGSPVHVSLLPCQVVTQQSVSDAVAMAFVESFVHDIETIAVAEFVE